MMTGDAAIIMWIQEALSLCVFPRSWQNQCRDGNWRALGSKPGSAWKHNTFTRAWFREILFRALFLKGDRHGYICRKQRRISGFGGDIPF